MRCKNKHGMSLGFTLIELMVSLAVVAIFAALATPALTAWRERTALVGATDLLRSDMKAAMSVSAKQEVPVVMRFQSENQNQEWCYALYRGGHCDCFQPTSCAGVEVIYQRTHADFSGIRLTPGVVDGRFTFQPQRRTVTAGNVQLTNQQNLATRIVVSGYGRIRVCSPAGSGHVDGYVNC